VRDGSRRDGVARTVEYPATGRGQGFGQRPGHQAAAIALRQFPKINASFAGNEIRVQNRVHRRGTWHVKLDLFAARASVRK
jgi:hypothetical protein